MDYDTFAPSVSCTSSDSESCYDLVAEERLEYDVDQEGKRNSDTASSTSGDRITQGRTLRIAMALVEGASAAADDRRAATGRLRNVIARATGRSEVLESDDALIARLRRLTRLGDRTIAEQTALCLVVDERELWKRFGCRNCILWMDRDLGICRAGGFERLRTTGPCVRYRPWSHCSRSAPRKPSACASIGATEAPTMWRLGRPIPMSR